MKRRPKTKSEKKRERVVEVEKEALSPDSPVSSEAVAPEVVVPEVVVEAPEVEEVVPEVKEARIENDEVVEEEIDPDYLRQYQYKKDVVFGSIESNPKGGKAEVMKNSLLLQDKVRILIPVDSGMDASIKKSINLNGYRLDLPKNTYIEVPKQIADVIMSSQKQEVQALSPLRIDRSKEGLDLAMK